MILAKTYEDYNNFNKEYIMFLENLCESDFNEDEELVINKLIEAKWKFEMLKLKCDDLEFSGENLEDIKDLNYLIVDSLFLSADLLRFYRNKEVERFKMRATNYLNKKRRLDIFNC